MMKKRCPIQPMDQAAFEYTAYRDLPNGSIFSSGRAVRDSTKALE